MPEPILNPELDGEIIVGGGGGGPGKKKKGDDGDPSELSLAIHGNARVVGDQRIEGNQFIDSSCVVRQNIYCAKALEASAYKVRTSTYGDPNDPQFDDEHLYTTNIVEGFVKNDADGNFLFGQAGEAGATALDQLTDVTLTFPAGREYLCFDSGTSMWVNQVIILDDLGDVIITSPLDGQSLVFDGGSSKWINKFNTELDDLTDVTITAPANGEYLCFDGSEWVNSAIPLDDLSDVTQTAAADGELLRFNGSIWINNTLAEAGVAAASHTHVEADITDLQAYLLPTDSIDDLADVDTTTAAPSIGEHLEWDGSNWVPSGSGDVSELNDLSDVSTAGAQVGSVLVFDGASDWDPGKDICLNSIFDPNQQEIVVFVSVPNALNHIEIENSALVSPLHGGPVKISAAGSQVNVPLQLSAKGPASRIIFETNRFQFLSVTPGSLINFVDAGDRRLLQLEADDVSPVNYLVIKSGDSGDPVNVFAQGSDNNVNLRLRGKGPNGRVIIQKDAEVANGDLCVEGKIDATAYEVKGLSLSGGFVKNLADGTFTFDNAGDGDVSELNDLSDVLASPGEGQVLQWGGSQWVGAPITQLFTSSLQLEEAVPSSPFNFLNGVGSGKIIFSVATSPNAASANYLQVTSGATGEPVLMEAKGDDTDINILLSPKGAGQVVSSSGFETSDSDAYYLGAKNSTGSWRFVRNGNDLEVERHDGASYVTKGSFTA